VFVLLLILIVVLFGFGFLNPIWWVAAAVLVYGATRYGRDRGEGRGRSGSSDLGDYRDYRDRRERWDRRYSRRNRARWRCEGRRDHIHRR
jgi:protein-S-isoprenylcysteine O-methyltransferase Ste14